MKQLKKISVSDNTEVNKVKKQIGFGKILKSMFIGFLIFWITLLYSCDVFVRVPIDDDGHRHYEHEHHEHHEHHDEPSDSDHG